MRRKTSEILSNNIDPSIINKIFDDLNNNDITQFKNTIDQNKVPLFYRNEGGQSVLHVIIKNQNFTNIDKYNLVVWAVQRGAPINSFDKYNITPLHLASKYQNYEIVNFLIENGANINSKDNNGLTPLHYAVEGKTLMFENLKQQDLIPVVKTEETYRDLINEIIEILSSDKYEFHLKHLSNIFIKQVNKIEFEFKDTDKIIDIIKENNENTRDSKIIEVFSTVTKNFIKNNINIFKKIFKTPIDRKEDKVLIYDNINDFINIEIKKKYNIIDNEIKKFDFNTINKNIDLLVNFVNSDMKTNINLLYWYFYAFLNANHMDTMLYINIFSSYIDGDIDKITNINVNASNEIDLSKNYKNETNIVLPHNYENKIKDEYDIKTIDELVNDLTILNNEYMLLVQNINMIGGSLEEKTLMKFVQDIITNKKVKYPLNWDKIVKVINENFNKVDASSKDFKKVQLDKKIVDLLNNNYVNYNKIFKHELKYGFEDIINDDKLKSLSQKNLQDFNQELITNKIPVKKDITKDNIVGDLKNFMKVILKTLETGNTKNFNKEIYEKLNKNYHEINEYYGEYKKIKINKEKIDEIKPKVKKLNVTLQDLEPNINIIKSVNKNCKITFFETLYKANLKCIENFNKYKNFVNLNLNIFYNYALFIRCFNLSFVRLFLLTIDQIKDCQIKIFENANIYNENTYNKILTVNENIKKVSNDITKIFKDKGEYDFLFSSWDTVPEKKIIDYSDSSNPKEIKVKRSLENFPDFTSDFTQEQISMFDQLNEKNIKLPEYDIKELIKIHDKYFKNEMDIDDFKLDMRRVNKLYPINKVVNDDKINITKHLLMLKTHYDEIISIITEWFLQSPLTQEKDSNISEKIEEQKEEEQKEEQIEEQKEEQEGKIEDKKVEFEILKKKEIQITERVTQIISDADKIINLIKENTVKQAKCDNIEFSDEIRFGCRLHQFDLTRKQFDKNKIIAEFNYIISEYENIINIINDIKIHKKLDEDFIKINTVLNKNLNLIKESATLFYNQILDFETSKLIIDGIKNNIKTIQFQNENETFEKRLSMIENNDDLLNLLQETFSNLIEEQEEKKEKKEELHDDNYMIQQTKKVILDYVDKKKLDDHKKEISDIVEKYVTNYLKIDNMSFYSNFAINIEREKLKSQNVNEKENLLNKIGKFQNILKENIPKMVGGAKINEFDNFMEIYKKIMEIGQEIMDYDEKEFIDYKPQDFKIKTIKTNSKAKTNILSLAQYYVDTINDLYKSSLENITKILNYYNRLIINEKIIEHITSAFYKIFNIIVNLNNLDNEIKEIKEKYAYLYNFFKKTYDEGINKYSKNYLKVAYEKCSDIIDKINKLNIDGVYIKIIGCIDLLNYFVDYINIKSAENLVFAYNLDFNNKIINVNKSYDTRIEHLTKFPEKLSDFKKISNLIDIEYGDAQLKAKKMLFQQYAIQFSCTENNKIFYTWYDDANTLIINPRLGFLLDKKYNINKRNIKNLKYNPRYNDKYDPVLKDNTCNEKELDDAIEVDDNKSYHKAIIGNKLKTDFKKNNFDFTIINTLLDVHYYAIKHNLISNILSDLGSKDKVVGKIINDMIDNLIKNIISKLSVNIVYAKINDFLINKFNKGINADAKDDIIKNLDFKLNLLEITRESRKYDINNKLNLVKLSNDDKNLHKIYNYYPFTKKTDDYYFIVNPNIINIFKQNKFFNPNIKNNAGHTPLMDAIEVGDIETIKLLKEYDTSDIPKKFALKILKDQLSLFVNGNKNIAVLALQNTINDELNNEINIKNINVEYSKDIVALFINNIDKYLNGETIDDISKNIVYETKSDGLYIENKINMITNNIKKLDLSDKEQQKINESYGKLMRKLQDELKIKKKTIQSGKTTISEISQDLLKYLKSDKLNVHEFTQMVNTYNNYLEKITKKIDLNDETMNDFIRIIAITIKNTLLKSLYETMTSANETVMSAELRNYILDDMPFLLTKNILNIYEGDDPDRKETIDSIFDNIIKILKKNIDVLIDDESEFIINLKNKIFPIYKNYVRIYITNLKIFMDNYLKYISAQKQNLNIILFLLK